MIRIWEPIIPMNDSFKSNPNNIPDQCLPTQQRKLSGLLGDFSQLLTATGAQIGLNVELREKRFTSCAVANANS